MEIKNNKGEEEKKLNDQKISRGVQTIKCPSQKVESQYLIAAFVSGLAVLFVFAFHFREYTKCYSELEHLENFLHNEEKSTKKFLVYGKNIESGYLHNVFYVLAKLNYEFDENATDWDLFWAHDYPFRVFENKLKNLKPHQKVNKFPGSGYITNKVDLATSNLKYIPPAFRLPKDKETLLLHASKNPNVEFVQKHNEHRNIFIKKIAEIDLDVEGTFVQEFVDKPFLVSGYKFDIGIYTIITSIDPLRVYIYNGDALLRFCPVKYNPFDSKNIDKYVVGDDYLPTWEVPDLKYYYKTLGFGMKESLNAYVRSTGKNPDIIWSQIEDAIRVVILDKEPQLINAANRFASKSNFFEMMRFDFVVNDNLEVFLMEANMSPNLSSAHFPQNKLLFEQVIFNLLGLVGVSERVKKDLYSYRSALDDEMLVADKNIIVFPSECGSSMCRTSCVSPICQICRPCLSSQTKNMLMQAYLEHLNKGTCKRIFPPAMEQKNISLEEDLEEYSAENQLQYRWFQGKCLIDSSWCT